ncbi:MAG: ribosome biogenesis GTPase [Gammaproteobacteria bacterium]|jgi:ribosome biogenesis GTPase
MAKRRLSQHQKKRIQGTQDAISSGSLDHIEGLIISHHGGKIVVESPEGDLIVCAVKSNLGIIVCGDIAVYEKTRESEFRVLALKPRRNLLQRIDGFGNLKSVAANLTQLLICLAVKPAPNLFLLDQYLLSAEQQAIDVVIVLNKADMLPTNSIDPFSLKSIYEPLGYKVLLASVKTSNGMDQLRAFLDNNTSVLSGVSGVGKSSITKALLPDIDVKISAISEANEEGRHTTRTSRLYHLPNNGNLIDTPGVRGFNPVLDDKIPVSAGFREVNRFSNDCRFSNCRHINEPKCAVIDAVSRHEITESRYQHYLRLVEKL